MEEATPRLSLAEICRQTGRGPLTALIGLASASVSRPTGEFRAEDAGRLVPAGSDRRGRGRPAERGGRPTPDRTPRSPAARREMVRTLVDGVLMRSDPRQPGTLRSLLPPDASSEDRRLAEEAVAVLVAAGWMIGRGPRGSQVALNPARGNEVMSFMRLHDGASGLVRDYIQGGSAGGRG